MSIIYNPRGRAGEYADWAANLYIGCSHKCRYCYSADVLRIPDDQRETFWRQPYPKTRVVANMDTDAKRLAKHQCVNVLLSFVCDDYQPLDAETGITRDVIKILHEYGHTFTVLTKGGTRALRDIDLYREGDVFACTLTCLDVGESLKWEPGAATPQDRLYALKTFHDAGIHTWVSLEPVIHPQWALELIRLTHPMVDLYKVGKMNYTNKLPEHLQREVANVDWRSFALDVTELLAKFDKRHYIKDDLKAYL
jgi:DNA repair photolyase